MYFAWTYAYEVGHPWTVGYGGGVSDQYVLTSQ